MAEKEGGGALKGLRQLTMDRGPQGYGFHMYTNKVLKVSLMTTSGPVLSAFCGYAPSVNVHLVGVSLDLASTGRV